MQTLISVLAPLGVGGFIGIVLSNWLTNKRDAAARHHQLQLRKLTEFYAPLLGLREEIRARSELRVKLQGAIDHSHVAAMIEAGPKDVEAASDVHLPVILKNIRDENETFHELLMPRYRDMVKIFRDNIWLAEPDTREHFPALIEFVDVWDKIIADKLPREIALAIGHTEANLKPFYSNLIATHDRLRRELGL